MCQERSKDMFVGKPQTYKTVISDIQKAIPKVTFCTHNVIVIVDARTGEMEIGISPDNVNEAINLMEQALSNLKKNRKLIFN